MCELAGVLFHVDATNTDALCFARFQFHIQPTLDANWLFILADLVSFGQVGVEIIFAGEDVVLVDLAVES